MEKVTLGALIIISFVLMVLARMTAGSTHDLGPQVPCYFIFGDSLSDNGNNNALRTSAKVNYAPYGIDFRGSVATGRFTNGRTVPDIIAEQLGFTSYIPSYAEGLRCDITKGVNYASGGAGIIGETGKFLGSHICLDAQVENHKDIVSRLRFNLGGSADSILNKCLYTINIGSNDFINNYFAPKSGYGSSTQFTVDQFTTMLIDSYSKQIQQLYNSGATKVALFGLGPLGCTLAQVAVYGTTNGSSCRDDVNSAANNFNQKLVALVDDLNTRFTDSKFTYINIIGMQFSPTQGFKVLNDSCCKVKKSGLCQRRSIPCPNRNEYIFWDYFHPTEAVNVILGGRAYNAQQPTDAHPMDISHLAQLVLGNSSVHGAK
ncbi:GDSL esterase/lipase-like protein, partial [Drosera capensis]